MANINLRQYGITGVKEILYNPTYEVLYNEETKPGLEGFDKGQVTELGAINVMTGIYTGRSPKDKYIVYDSMGEDAVKRYHGSAVLKDCSAEQLEGQAEEVGTRISRRFLSNWITESYSFYYFDDFSSESWFTPLQDAADGKFAKAVQGWEPLVKDGSNLKRACACFNLAQAFYLLGDYVISSRWLDEADKLENLTQVPALRKRLASHLEK